MVQAISFNVIGWNHKPESIFTDFVLLKWVSYSFCKDWHGKVNSSNEPKILNEEMSKTELKDIIGKTYEFNYSEELIYHVKFESDSTVNWKLKKGDYAGPSDETDKYIYSQ